MFIFIKVLFPWAQEESNSRRQWVCWCCRTQCCTEIPSLSRLACTLGNRAAAAAQSSGLDQHMHPGLHVNSLTLSKNFFFGPWLPDCSVRSQRKCDGSRMKRVAAWRGFEQGQGAACPGSLQSNQAAHPGLKSRLLQESTKVSQARVTLPSIGCPYI